MYLITGSTGNIGRSVVEELTRQGHKVRALVRNPSRGELLPDGTDLAIGDLDDVDSVTAALDGADAAFLLHAGQGTSQTQVMIDAARSAGVSKIVLLSSIGACLRPLPTIGETLKAREDLLRASGLEVTYLRPNTLMSNALAWAAEIRDEGRVTDTSGPGLMPCVDPDDIARVAALVLTEHGHAGHGYILNGPEALSSREQVETLSDVLGRSIELVEITPAELAQRMIAQGTPAPAAAALQNLNEMFRTSRAGVVTSDIENLTGTPPRTFRQWCEAHVDAFS